MTSVPSDETALVEKTVSRSVRAKAEKAHERESRNWFLKLFTW